MPKRFQIDPDPKSTHFYAKPKGFQKADLISKVERPEHRSFYMRTREHEEIEDGFLKGEGYIYSKDLDILKQQGSSTGAYPIISEERRSPRLGAPKSSKAKSIEHLQEQRIHITQKIAQALPCSRRAAKALVMSGKISVNGDLITNPAVKVALEDIVKVNNCDLPKASGLKLWAYYKPCGVITTHKDPENRQTVFSQLPKMMPRVVSIGRLDINSEGLLLLTNKGDFARFCELPRNKLIRRYKVKVFGDPRQHELDKLKDGCTINGVSYGPFHAKILDQTSRNAWLDIVLYEGKNREIRKILGELDLKVKRLIREQYGPWSLHDLAIRQVKELKIPSDIYDEYLVGLGK